MTDYAWTLHSNSIYPTIGTPVPIKIQLLHEDARPLKKVYIPGDVAWDVACIADEGWRNYGSFGKKEKPFFELMPGESHTFSTGIKVGTPHNYGFLLRERSGLGIKSDIAVGAGVIEGTYRDEWKIHLRNHGKKPKVFNIGDRICQAVFTLIIPASIEVVDHLPPTERGENGFGSSGN